MFNTALSFLRLHLFGLLLIYSGILMLNDLIGNKNKMTIDSFN